MVRAGAATPLPVLARQAAEAGWSGLTWAVGVPGSVGGAVRMNAGGHGADMAGCLLRYTWVDLLGDRGGTDEVARLALRVPALVGRGGRAGGGGGARRHPRGCRGGTGRLSSIVRWRRRHQPGGSNAGSVFTNPPGDPAGKLIEEAGLKGFRLGTAHVSEKHANFIQAEKGGRADDVRALMEHVRRQVLAHGGVSLSAEVRLLGFEEGETGAMVGTEGDGSEPQPPPGPRPAPGGPPEPRDKVDPRISARRTEVSRQQGRRRLRMVGAAAAAALLAFGAWSLLHSFLFSARAVTVVGAVHETTAQIEAAAGLSGHPPLLDVNAVAAERGLDHLPWVRQALVTVHWPDGVRVQIVEQVPKLVMPLAGGAMGRAGRGREGSRRGGHPSPGADGTDGTEAGRAAGQPLSRGRTGWRSKWPPPCPRHFGPR